MPAGGNNSNNNNNNNGAKTNESVVLSTTNGNGTTKTQIIGNQATTQDGKAGTSGGQQIILGSALKVLKVRRETLFN
jgi:hypothetical protein